MKQTLTSQYIFDLLRKTLQQSNLLSESLKKQLQKLPAPWNWKLHPTFLTKKTQAEPSDSDSKKTRSYVKRCIFYFNTTSYEKQKFTTGQWFVTSVALSFSQFTSGTWNLVQVFLFFLASLNTFRKQARSQSKGLLFDSMILWERNPTEKKLPKILFLSSRSCCSFHWRE